MWQYYRDDPNDNITESESFKYKIKITGKAPAAGNTKGGEIAVPLKCLSNFWRTLEMPLISCEINLILTWSEDYVISSATQETKFKTADTKLYVTVVTLSSQYNAKLLQQLKSGFKRSVNWNKFQTKISTEGVNQYLDFSIDPSFQGVNRLFVLSFQNERDRKIHTACYLPKVETKDFKVVIDGKNIIKETVENDIRTYDHIQKISTGQGDDYTTGCLLDYNYFKKHYKMIAIDLRKQQELDSDPKAMQQLNFTGNIENQSKIFFIIEKAKEIVLNFPKSTVKVF